MVSLIRVKDNNEQIKIGTCIRTTYGWPITVVSLVAPSHLHPGGAVVGHDRIVYSPSELGAYATTEN